MALLHIDGFDVYKDAIDVVQTGGYNAASSVYSYLAGGRFPTSKYMINMWNAIFIKKQIPNSTILYTGFAFYSNDLANFGGNYLCCFFDSSNVMQLRIRVSTTGVLTVERGATVMATMNKVLLNFKWYYISMAIEFDNVNGSFQLYVDGTKEIDLTNVDNQETANSGCSYVALYGCARHVRFDDWYIADTSGAINNALIKEARVVSLVPVADTSQKDFTASAGSVNYAMVDEDMMDSDSTYVSTSTSGAKDIYDLGNLPAGVDTVYGVVTHSWARKDNTDAVVFNFGIKSGATESFSSGRTMSTDYTGFSFLSNSDPGTSGAWSVSAVNSLQCGFTTTI